MNKQVLFDKFSSMLEMDKILIDTYFSLKFQDPLLELQYREYLLKFNKNIRLIINLVSLILTNLRLLNFIKKEIFQIDFYLDLFTGIMILILFILIFLMNSCIKKMNIIIIIGYIYTSMICLLNAYSSILYNYLLHPQDQQIILRNVYMMIILTTLEFLYCFEYNFYVALFVFLINILTTTWIYIINFDIIYQAYQEIIVAFLIILLIIFLKKYFSTLSRQSYLNNLKQEKNFLYCFDLINNSIGPQFTMKNNKIILHNKIFENFLLRSNITKNLFKKGNQDFLSFYKKGKISAERFEVINSNPHIHSKSIIITNEDFIKRKEFSFEKIESPSNVTFDLKNNEEKNKYHLKKLTEKILENLLNLRRDENNFTFCREKIRLKEKAMNLKEQDLINNKIVDNKIKKDNKNFISINKSKKLKIHKYENSLNDKKYIFSSCSNKENLNKQTILNSKIRFNNDELELQVKNNIENNDLSSLNFEDNDEFKEHFSNIIFSLLFLDDFGELYLRNIKKKSLSNELMNLTEDNLYSIIDKLGNFPFLNEDNYGFNFLGDFYLEEDKKHFQIYFRRHPEIKHLIDFFFYDLTKIKEVEQNQFYLKSSFFAKVAHEFKTPLNSILGLIKKLDHLFKENIDHKKIRFNLKQIENLSNYVILLINDIIQYSNICAINNEKGEKNFPLINEKKLNLKIEIIDLKEITTFTKNVLQTLIINKEKEKFVAIKYEFDKNISNYKIISDEFRLKQMLLNLISNAVKFTKSGSITINSKLIKASDKSENKIPQKSNFVKISIIDTGLGIEDSELKSLLKFKDINIFDGVKEYNQDGTGLGLGITKFLGDQLNHKIEIETRYGKGSSFSIIIKAEKKEMSIKRNIQKNESERILNRSSLLDRSSFEEKNFFKSDSDYYNNKKRRNNEKKFNQIKEEKKSKSETLKDYKITKKILRKSELKQRNLNSNYQNGNNDTIIFDSEIYNIVNSRNLKPSKFKPFLNHNSNSEQLQNANIKFFSYLNSSEKENIFEVRSEFKHKDNFYQKNFLLKNKSEGELHLIKFMDEKDPNLSKKNLINDGLFFDLYENSTEKYSSCFENPYINKLLKFDSNGRIYINKDYINDDNNKTIIKSNNNKSFINNLSSDEINDDKNFIKIINQNNYNYIDFSSNNVNFSPSCISKYEEENNSKDRINIINQEFQDKNKDIILLVDDHLYIREAIKNIIKKILKEKNLENKFLIKEGKDGTDIINSVIKDQFENNRIKCVITDENMEFINGSEAIKILKNIVKNKKIKPIIIASITAIEDDFTKALIKSVGGDYILPKPCTEESLKKFFYEFKIFYSNQI